MRKMKRILISLFSLILTALPLSSCDFKNSNNDDSSVTSAAEELPIHKAQWTTQDIFNKTKTVVEGYAQHEGELTYEAFLDKLSKGYIQGIYLDSLQFLHFSISWIANGETLEAPFALPVGRVSPAKTEELTTLLIHRFKIEGNNLYAVYEDGTQADLGSFISRSVNQTPITAFGITPDDEFVVYYENEKTLFAGKIPQGSPTQSQAPLIYHEIDNAYEIAGILDLNTSELEIPLSHRGKPITSIKRNAFSASKNLERVTIGENITKISPYAFAHCSALKEVILHQGITAIEHAAFADCPKLEEIILWQGITSIEEYAFADCTSLKYMKLPSGITSIGWRTFFNCTALEWVVVPASLNVTNYAKFVYENDAKHFFFEQKKPAIPFHPDVLARLHFKGEWSYVNGIPTVN